MSETYRYVFLFILLFVSGTTLGILYGFKRLSDIKREIQRPPDRFSKELGDRQIGKQYLIRGGGNQLENLLYAFFTGMRERNMPNVRLVRGRFADEEMNTESETIYVDTIIGNTLVSFPVLVSLYGSQDLHYSWLRFTKRRKTGRIVPRDGRFLWFILIPVSLLFLLPFDIACRMICNLDNKVRMSLSPNTYSEDALKVAIANLETLVNVVLMEAIDRVGISSDAVQEIVVPPTVGKLPIKLYP